MLPLLLLSGIAVSKCGWKGAEQEQSSFLAGQFGKLEIGVGSREVPWVDELRLGWWSSFRQIGMSASAGALQVLGLGGKRPSQLQQTSSVEIGRTPGGRWLLASRCWMHPTIWWIPAIQWGCGDVRLGYMIIRVNHKSLVTSPMCSWILVFVYPWDFPI
jgi:hypothetical protein